MLQITILQLPLLASLIISPSKHREYSLLSGTHPLVKGPLGHNVKPLDRASINRLESPLAKYSVDDREELLLFGQYALARPDA